MNKKTTAAKPAERPRAAKVTVPEPEPIDPAPIEASPVVEFRAEDLRVETVAAKAYEFFRAGRDGDFPEWDEVSSRGRNLYEEAARHVISGSEPRTDFERTVVEVLHG